MDSSNPLDGARVGNILGLGTSQMSSSAATTPVDKKVKKKKNNAESQRTYRFNLTLKSCETNGKEVLSHVPVY